jgi:hypothetical protein
MVLRGCRLGVVGVVWVLVGVDMRQRKLVRLRLLVVMAHRVHRQRVVASGCCVHMGHQRVAQRLHLGLLVLSLLLLENSGLLRCLFLGALVLSPCLSKFLELSWETLGAMLLHVNVGIQVVEGTIGFLALAPVTNIESLNLVKTTARTLFGVDTGERNKGIDLGSIDATIQTGHVGAILSPASWVHGTLLLLMVLGDTGRV